MQERGGDRHVVEPEVGQDERHAERVRDVRIAGPADLVGVGLDRDLVGLSDQRGVGAAVATAIGLDERHERGGDRMAPPREAPQASIGVGAGLLDEPGHHLMLTAARRPPVPSRPPDRTIPTLSVCAGAACAAGA